VTAIRNILTFDVEDWPQSTLDHDLPITERVRTNTLRLLDLLALEEVKGTFFVLGLVAERFPGLVRDIEDRGHEVASHGFSHRPVHGMTPEQFRGDLKRSLAAIGAAARGPVLGYRAPDFSIPARSLWALRIIAEEGFKYDSSIFPIAGPRYGIREAFPSPHLVRCGDDISLVEFPMTTTEYLGYRLPAAGGGYFRVWPYFHTRLAIARLNRRGHPATSYFHPYETDPDELRRSPFPIPLALRLSQGLGRSGVPRRLRRLLGDFAWGPARDRLGEAASLTGGRVLDLTPLPAGGPRWLSPAPVAEGER
jgi:polysaccharide deacetylase family protein (PEP-CTERM system associated)